MRLHEQALEIQRQFCFNVCKGYVLYSKTHNMTMRSTLRLNGHSLTYQTVYNVIKGNYKYISSISLFILAQSVGLSSPSQLEKYYLENKTQVNKLNVSK